MFSLSSDFADCKNSSRSLCQVVLFQGFKRSIFRAQYRCGDNLQVGKFEWSVLRHPNACIMVFLTVNEPKSCWISEIDFAVFREVTRQPRTQCVVASFSTSELLVRRVYVDAEDMTHDRGLPALVDQVRAAFVSNFLA